MIDTARSCAHWGSRETLTPACAFGSPKQHVVIMYLRYNLTAFEPRPRRAGPKRRGRLGLTQCDTDRTRRPARSHRLNFSFLLLPFCVESPSVPWWSGVLLPPGALICCQPFAAVLPGPQMQALNQELYEDMMNSVPRNLPLVRLLEPSLT